MCSRRLQISKAIVENVSKLNKKRTALCGELCEMATNMVLGKGGRMLREEARKE